MSPTQMSNLLERIVMVQTGWGDHGDGTAPVELSVGYVSSKTRMVCHDGIVIKSAPGAVVKEVYAWTSEEGGIFVEAGEGGLIIR